MAGSARGSLPDFSYLGPDAAPAWSDPLNIGKLCSRCKSLALEDFLWDHHAQLKPSSTAVSDGFFNHSVGHRTHSPDSTAHSDSVLYQRPGSRPISPTGSDRANYVCAIMSRKSTPPISASSEGSRDAEREVEERPWTYYDEYDRKESDRRYIRLSEDYVIKDSRDAEREVEERPRTYYDEYDRKESDRRYIRLSEDYVIKDSRDAEREVEERPRTYYDEYDRKESDRRYIRLSEDYVIKDSRDAEREVEERPRTYYDEYDRKESDRRYVRLSEDYIIKDSFDAEREVDSDRSRDRSRPLNSGPVRRVRYRQAVRSSAASSVDDGVDIKKAFRYNRNDFPRATNHRKRQRLVVRDQSRLLQEMRTNANAAFAALQEIESWSDIDEVVDDKIEPAVPTYYDTYHSLHAEWDAEELGILPPSKAGRDRARMQGYQTTIWSEMNGPTLAEVRRAAHEGCHFCTMILSTWLVRRANLKRQIEDRGWRATIGDQSYENLRIFLALRNGYLFGYTLKPQRGYEARFGFGFTVLETKPPGRRPMLPSSGSLQKYVDEQRAKIESAESIAKQWLNICLTTHGSTCSQQEAPVLPSRVIDVQSRHTENQVSLFRSNGERAQYATLSYCWGKSDILTSTSETLSDRCKGIPLDSLPETFRSAVEMTRALGLQYLWIDALCILQDSVEDCQKELGLMAEIYTNSTVTIAAIGAQSAGSGFTINRNKLAMTDCPLGLSVTISAHLEGQELELEAGTIHERGWCFQEIQLSPRLLSCGGKELYYSCRKGAFREGNPTEAFHAESGKNIKRPFDDMPRNSQDAYARWRMQVETYSTLQLTFSQDRLSAISGVATHFLTLFSTLEESPSATDYLAGLWRADLIRELQWTRSWPIGPISPRYVAPSWSWAAAGGSVGFKNGFSVDDDLGSTEKNHIVCKILEAHTTPKSQLAPFGSVSSGKLVLFGPVKRLTQDAYDDSLREEAWQRAYSNRGLRRQVDSEVNSDEDADPGRSRRGKYKSAEADGYSSKGFEYDSHDLDPVADLSRSPSTTSNKYITRRDRRRSARYQSRSRSRRSSEPSDSNDSPFCVRWDAPGSHDINCVCILFTARWGLVLSPVRIPGAGDIYQRVGYFECDEREKFPLLGRNSRLASFDWEFKLVTIM